MSWKLLIAVPYFFFLCSAKKHPHTLPRNKIFLDATPHKYVAQFCVIYRLHSRCTVAAKSAQLCPPFCCAEKGRDCTKGHAILPMAEGWTCSRYIFLLLVTQTNFVFESNNSCWFIRPANQRWNSPDRPAGAFLLVCDTRMACLMWRGHVEDDCFSVANTLFSFCR